jgi:hypothetical protein
MYTLLEFTPPFALEISRLSIASCSEQFFTQNFLVTIPQQKIVQMESKPQTSQSMRFQDMDLISQEQLLKNVEHLLSLYDPEKTGFLTKGYFGCLTLL